MDTTSWFHEHEYEYEHDNEDEENDLRRFNAEVDIVIEGRI